jgi:4-amino-4-deoxy-L-arabinose transferase-like glycosyltransferase
VSKPAAEPHGAPRVPVAIFVALIIAFGVLVRMRLLDLPLERDEGEYAYAGQLMLEGIPPYQLAYNMKFPGTYAAYALIEAAFGETTDGIRIGLIIVTSATAFLIYLLGLRLIGRGAGMAAAAAYTVLSVSLASQGFYAHATHFVMLAAMGGFVLLVDPSPRARGEGGASAPREGRHSAQIVTERPSSAASRHLLPTRGENDLAVTPLLAGALLGVAVLMKQPGAVFAIFGVLWMLAERRWRDSGLVTAGGAIVAAITAIWLAATGVFGRFWFWTIKYAREYASETSLADAKGYLVNTFYGVYSWTPLLWWAIAAGVVLMLAERTTRRAGVIITALIAVSFIGTSAGLLYRNHYFLLMFPACALAAGGGVAAGMRLVPEAARFAAPIVFGVVLLVSIAMEWRVIAQYSPEKITRILHGDSPFIQAPRIAEYLREHTSPDDRIAVLGSEPEIYFLAGRKSATGYVYMYPLMEHQPYAHTMQQEMIREIDRANPKYIVTVSVAYSWLAKPDSDKSVFEYGERKVRSAYKLDGVVDEVPGGTVYVWGADAERYQPKSSGVVFLFRRR